MSSPQIDSQSNTDGNPEVPLELRKLDDAVLVFTSDEGEVGDAHSSAGAQAAHDSCCHEHGTSEENTATYIELVFKGERRGYYINETGEQFEPGDAVIVEAEKGVDLGEVGSLGSTAFMKSRLRTRPCQETPRKVLRRATDEDLRIVAFHRDQEVLAHDICLEKIHMLDLPMKLVDVEYQFDRNRITFYFTADGRVDFRELVRELAAEYRTRIELRQIGPRDEAKRMGGFGVCGRELCCSSWLGVFEPISTEMARLQNLSLNPFKLAGQCGRLKCCLSYEAQLYEELLKRFPPMDYRVCTKKGEGTIEKIDIFQDAIYVHYPGENSWDRMTLDELHVLMEATEEAKKKAPVR